MTDTVLENLPLWETMGTITLDEMDSIKLMNRIDTKFVTNRARLLDILGEAAAQGYRVNVIDGHTVQGYNSVYYDTESLQMFTAHRCGKRTRQKVRVRTYLSSRDTFLEIKRKRNNGRTKKKRIALPAEFAMDFGKSAEASAFLEAKSWWKAAELSPEVSTTFKRITLVNASRTERLTIDSSLKFENFRNGNKADLKDCVIIELKQDGRAESEMKSILLANRIFPFRVSKYCMGVCLTQPELPKGRFKMKIRYIEKQINTKLI